MICARVWSQMARRAEVSSVSARVSSSAADAAVTAGFG
jgi:hypothetical protein